MCGIAGFIDIPEKGGTDALRSTALAMANAIRHRGPDGEGVWLDPETGIVLAHRRLSILDLSTAGSQPMISACGRYVIAYNGEVYNHREIRKKLELSPSPLPSPTRGEGEVSAGVSYVVRETSPQPSPAREDGEVMWHGHSDTEVMLAAISRWGLEDAVKRFVGMFAFALWDRRERTLHLVRDRLGEKPLYYGWMGKTLLFGSELKALRAHPEWHGEIDRGALTLYLRHNHVPAPYSIYKGISKLPPGTILSIPAKNASGRPLIPRPYWSAKATIEKNRATLFRGTETEAAEQLDALLRHAIGQQMLADVPLGAFLSGGVDSSAVVALMQAQSGIPVKTFTIGFHEEAYDEAAHAAAVARHLGTEHTELYVTPAETMKVIPQLPQIYDEPFADSSQIPTFLVAQLARQHVTVSLSGDGGDELFGGYNRHFRGKDIWNRTSRLPLPLRRLAAAVLTAVPPRSWDRLFTTPGTVLPAGLRQRAPGEKLHKLAEILAAGSPEDAYLRLISQWQQPAEIVLEGRELSTIAISPQQWPQLPDFAERMMFLDLVSYLPDDILVKVDRATMAVGLESRTPYLDHRIAEFAWSLPLAMKMGNGQGKRILRQVLYQYVPKELIERPKTGFGVPLDAWLRGPLRAWAENLLDENRLRREGFFAPAPIRKKWEEHLSGRRNWQHPLWAVLMFQSWLGSQ